jgi:hypothetical protein
MKPQRDIEMDGTFGGYVKITDQPLWETKTVESEPAGNTDKLEVTKKRQRKPWLYRSEHERIVEEIEMDNVIMLFKGIGIGMIAGLIAGIFGTLIFT